MKKLIILIFLIILWGCGQTKSSQEPESSDSISVTSIEEIIEEIPDSSNYPYEYVETPAEENIAQLASQKKIMRDPVKGDSTLANNEHMRSFLITKLDTISLLPEIRRNKEIINQQQQILDSLIKKK